jgi:release factor glutamine methyltransferase
VTVSALHVPPVPVGEAARSAGEGCVSAWEPLADEQPSPQPSPRGRGIDGLCRRRGEEVFFRFRRRAWRKLLHIRMLLLDRRRYQSVLLENVAGLTILVLPDVFNPKLLRSGEFLVQQLTRRELLSPGSRVLDLGSGSGAAAAAAARRGCDVVAVDINPAAVRCTRINALLNDVEVDARQGDLFAPVQGERFDVVLFNPPYYRGIPRNALDHAWRSPDLVERFSASLAAYLTQGGHALLVLSSDGEQSSFLAALDRAGFRSTVVAERDLINETLSVYCLTHADPV